MLDAGLEAGPVKAWAILQHITRATRQNISPNYPFQIVKATFMLWIRRSWAQSSHITPWNCPYDITEMDKMLKYNVISSVLETLRRYSIQQRELTSFKAVITYNVPTICTVLKIDVSCKVAAFALAAGPRFFLCRPAWAYINFGGHCW